MAFEPSNTFGSAFDAISRANTAFTRDLGINALDGYTELYNNKRILDARGQVERAAGGSSALGDIGKVFGMASSVLGMFKPGGTKISDSQAFDAGKSMGSDLASSFFS